MKVKADEAIFIPEGYWHSVDALEKEGISINYWFKGI